MNTLIAILKSAHGLDGRHLLAVPAIVLLILFAWRVAKDMARYAVREGRAVLAVARGWHPATVAYCENCHKTRFVEPSGLCAECREPNVEFRGGCKPSSGTSCSASDGGDK